MSYAMQKLPISHTKKPEGDKVDPSQPFCMGKLATFALHNSCIDNSKFACCLYTYKDYNYVLYKSYMYMCKSYNINHCSNSEFWVTAFVSLSV